MFSLLNPKAAEDLESPEIVYKRLCVYICICTFGGKEDGKLFKDFPESQ